MYYCIGFLKTKTVRHFETTQFKSVSIIICARNEEKYIGRCIAGILSQKYPLHLVEIILIDDASTDKTLSIAQTILKQSKIKYQIIENKTKKGKKLSLSDTIKMANHELIITRDADTFTVSEEWLSHIVLFQTEKQSDFIIAPVALNNNIGLFWALQAIENNTLAVLTGGSHFFHHPFLCNGANLAFTKTIYHQCNGYDAHLHLASGDDVLFLEQVKKLPGSKINYLKSEKAIVYTYPHHSLKSLFNQKIRWASKFKYNSNPLNTFLAVLIFIVNFAWLFCFVDGFVHPSNNGGTFLFILIKLGLDFLILLVASTLVKNKNLLWYSLPVGFIYPLYACVVALASVFLKPQWKK